MHGGDRSLDWDAGFLVLFLVWPPLFLSLPPAFNGGDGGHCHDRGGGDGGHCHTNGGSDDIGKVTVVHVFRAPSQGRVLGSAADVERPVQARNRDAPVIVPFLHVHTLSHARPVAVGSASACLTGVICCHSPWGL